jgi:hypothetical protein
MWYLLLVLILFGAALSLHYYRGASQEFRGIANSGLSVLFGAVVGAITLYWGQAVSERRKKRGELLAELPVVAHEAIAALMEVYVARQSMNDKTTPVVLMTEAARLARVEGNAARFEFEWRLVFSGCKPRAAVNKLRQRIVLAKEFVLTASSLSPEQVEQAIDWIAEQTERTAHHGSKEAGHPLIDPATIQFVGFRRVTEEDKRDLSFEDQPPPWLESEHRTTRPIESKKQ